jgi:hypothetical protein
MLVFINAKNMGPVKKESTNPNAIPEITASIINMWITGILFARLRKNVQL